MAKSTAQGALKLLPDDPQDDPGQLVDGGYLISDEQLKRLGAGDAKNGRRWLRLLMADHLEPKQHAGPTERPQSVRVADELDELAIFDLILASYRENVSNVYPLAPDLLIADIQQATQKQGGIAGVIDGPDGTPIAVIVIAPDRWRPSKAYYLRELYTYVHPDHRKSRNAENLLQFGRWVADEWSRGFGYPLHLVLSVGTTTNVSSKIRFFRRFASQVGAMFMYPSPGKAV